MRRRACMFSAETGAGSRFSAVSTYQRPSPASSLTDLAVQIPPHSPLQLARALTEGLREILDVIRRRDAEAPHDVLGRALQVAVVAQVGHAARAALRLVVLGSSEVCVRGDRRGALEAL